ncbi:hypothetical protein GL305_33395 [Nocardia seriolae]|nr:hypothetical protein [Nocardia seriolae]MTJ74404.1 hypothetical protein [Nocardia seriolae]MTJ90727.1 hypothetical protein [Nocardia seriolae]MTK34686.1 hypothetical protein [Nocardia seriolae]MTK39126.1 hypothetical protein [Nocardia seriolae]
MVVSKAAASGWSTTRVRIRKPYVSTDDRDPRPPEFPDPRNHPRPPRVQAHINRIHPATGMKGAFMHRISIRPDGLTTYATTTALLSSDVATITTHTASASPDLLAPAFGLIGADFLTAYAAAHTTHVDSLTNLSAALAGMVTATGDAASAYSKHDAAYAAALRTQSRELSA